MQLSSDGETEMRARFVCHRLLGYDFEGDADAIGEVFLYSCAESRIRRLRASCRRGVQTRQKICFPGWLFWKIEVGSCQGMPATLSHSYRIY